MSEEIQDAQLVASEPQSRAVTIHRPMLTRESIKSELEQRTLLGEYISKSMVLNEDYGPIPGAGTKKVLLKPGAEKLVQLFYCTAKYFITSKTEKPDEGLYAYHWKCEIYNNAGHLVAEGVSYCSTHESKYRWRQPSRKCPACGAEAIFKSKNGPGWYCWGKKGGCGQQFPNDNEPSIVSQSVEKDLNPDIADCINTVVKIGKKRALVDAALALARCSDLFTQDIDENEQPEVRNEKARSQQEQQDVKDGNARHQQQKAKPAESRGEAIQNQQAPQQAPQQQDQPGKKQYPKYECPKCGKMAVGRSQYPPRGGGEPGWFCYDKSGGCKAQFKFGDVSFKHAVAELQGGQQQGPSKIAADCIDGWRSWVGKNCTVGNVEQFNKGLAASIEDLSKLAKPDKDAVWGVIVELADGLGLVYGGADHQHKFIKK